MTVDTVVKIVESEKCGLDMSSYEDLHSSVTNVGGNSNGDSKDDYVFVNDSDVVSSDDHSENHEIREVNVAKLADNHENVVKLSVEGDDNVKVASDVVSSEDRSENHEVREVNVTKLADNHENVAKLSVEGDDNVKVASDVVSSEDRSENREVREVNVAKLAENHESSEVNVAESSVEGDDNVKVSGDVALSDYHSEKIENGEVNVVESSVEGDDNVKVNGEVESDRLENGVKVDEEVSKIENEVNVGEESEGGVEGKGLVVENKEIKSENEVVVAENGGSDSNVEVDFIARVPEVNEGSGLEHVEDEVKEDSISEPVLEEIKEVTDLKPVVDEVKEVESGFETADNSNASDEVKESSVLEPVVDEVKESSDPKLVDEVKEVETVFENGDNGNVSFDSVGSRSLDVEENDKNSNQVKEVESVIETGDNGSASVESIGSRSLDVEDNDKNSNEVKEGETVCGSGENGNASVDSIGSRSLDVDDNSKNSVYDAQESAEVETEDTPATHSVPNVPEPSEVEAQIDTATMGVPEGELEAERQIVLPSENGIEIKGSEPERLEDQSGKPKVTENNGDIHGVDTLVAEIKSVDCREMESKPLETNVSGQFGEDDLAEVQSLDNATPEEPKLTENNDDVKASFPLDVEGNGLPSEDTTPEEHSSDCHEQNLPLGDVENEKQDLIEVEAKVDEQGDVDTVIAVGSQESVNLEAAGGELDQCEKAEITDQIGLGSTGGLEEAPDIQSLTNQSEGADNQRLENPVSVIVGQSDELKLESTAGVDDNTGALTANMQFDTTDKSALEGQPERVDEVITETRGGQEASPGEGVLQNQAVEQTESFDVVDKEISLKDDSSEKTLPLVDTTNFSKLQSEDDTTTEPNDQARIHDRDNVSENKVVPASTDFSVDTGSDLRSEDKLERGVVGDVSSATDNSLTGFADDTSSQAKLENSNVPVHDTKTMDSEIDETIKSNNIVDGTLRPNISFGSFGCESSFSHSDIKFQSDVSNKSITVGTVNGEALLNSSANGDHSDELNSDIVSAQVAQPEQIDEVSALAVEGSEADSSDGQNINPDLVRRPFYWLIKVPRFDEGKYKDQLRQIDIKLAEKTEARDASQAEFYKQQVYCRELKTNCDAINLEVKAARELVWAKSREIDSAHSIINLARNAVTVEDLDKKIHNLEHRMQHQTLNNLKEEKELVREIKQLNLQRQKLSADPQREQAVQQARDQRDQTQEQLKVLKKEMDGLRDNLSKAEERFRAARKKLDDESVLLNDLKQQLKSANDIRQEAYVHLMTLKKQLNEKNTPFYKAKTDLRIAYDYANAGKRDSLERHCVNQVEKVMEIWNKNDEFRKEYIQCNMRRMLWKFGTSDGTCLGINEVPPSLGNVSDNRVNTSAKVNLATPVLTAERDLPVEPKITEDKQLKKVEQKKVPPVKKIEAIPENSLAKASDINEIEEDTKESKLTREQEELIRKEEQIRREKEAAKLREQRRLEEKAKAEEALERKRRNAIKAQARAEFKARKEAEEKEKEKEKRAKKKGKKGNISEISENEPAQPSEPSSETFKEPEVTEKPVTMSKRSQKPSLHSKQIKTTKPIPPALRNKGKRGLLRYWPYACIVLLAIALFYLGSFERIQTIKQHISALLHQ